MSDCDCGEPFRYDFTTPNPPIEGNGIFLYPDCEKRKWIYVHAAVHACFAIEAENDGDTAGYLYACGSNSCGTFGDGTYRSSSGLVRVGKSKWRSVVTTAGGLRLFYNGEDRGWHGVLAIKDDGSLWSWGRNVSGELGTGDFFDDRGGVESQYAAPSWVYGLNNQQPLQFFYYRAMISSSVERVGLVVSRIVRASDSVWSSVTSASFNGDMSDHSEFGSPKDTGPQAFWRGGGGFMRRPSLRVVTVTVDGDGNLLELESGEHIGSGAVVEPIFDAEVVGVDHGNGTELWDSLGLMPIVTDGGSGYTSAPSVVFSGGCGSGAKAKAEVEGGSVSRIVMLSGGRGYESPPEVSFVGGGGSGASATVQILGKVSGFEVKNGGQGYSHSFHVPDIGDDFLVPTFGEGITRPSWKTLEAKFLSRVVVVKAERSDEDDFLDRLNAAAPWRPGFEQVSGLYVPGAGDCGDYIGVCRLSPSSIVSLIWPSGFQVGRDAHVTYTNEDDALNSKPFDIAAWVQANPGDDGEGAEVLADFGPVIGGVRRRLFISLARGGDWYRSEPRIFVGARNTPKLVDEGPWKEVATSGGKTIGIKEDGSIWVWGERNDARDYYQPSNYYSYLNVGQVDYFPQPLGRWIKIVANRGATFPPPDGPPPAQAVEAGTCELPFSDSNHSQYGYESAPSLNPVAGEKPENSNETPYTLTVPLNKQVLERPGIEGFGPVQSITLSVTAASPPEAELYGPASGKRVFSFNGEHYVIDGDDVLWKIAYGQTKTILGRPKVRNEYYVSADGKYKITSTVPDHGVTTVRVQGGEGLETPSFYNNVYRLGLSVGYVSLEETATESGSEFEWKAKTKDQYIYPLLWGGGMYSYTDVSGTSVAIGGDGVVATKNNESLGGCGVTLEAYSTDKEVVSGKSNVTLCGGKWKDFSPEHQIGLTVDKELRAWTQFSGVDDDFFSGVPLPDDYLTDLGRPEEILPGGLIVRDDKLWALPRGPHISGMACPARVAAYSVRLGDTGSGIVTAPSVTATQPPQVAMADVDFEGEVYSVGVIDGGSGYSDPPELTISGGGGSDATATATIEGPVSSVELASGGSGYSTPPNVCFSTPGVPAKASCTLSGGISEIRITARGRGYSSRPQVVITGGFGASATANLSSDGGVESVTVQSPGYGFKSQPQIAFSGGGGTGAAAVARLSASVESVSIISGGAYRSPPTFWFEPQVEVSSISLTSGGAGYATPPQVVIVGGGGEGATAFAELERTLRNATVTITNSGSGYTSAPEVLLLGGGGAGATAAAFVSNGVVVGVTIQAHGSGFTSTPRVTFSGGGGSGAEAIILLPVGRVNLAEGGKGYVSPPRVVFVGSGDGASAVASIGTAPGSGGGGTCGINGSVIYARVGDAGSLYTSHPLVEVSPPQLTGGRTAVLQAKIVGRVTGVTLQSGGSMYVDNPPPGGSIHNRLSRGAQSAVRLRGVPCSDLYANRVAGVLSSPYGRANAELVLLDRGDAPEDEFGEITDLSIEESLDSDRHLKNVFFYQKPEICFADTISVSPVVDMEFASLAVGMDFYDAPIKQDATSVLNGLVSINVLGSGDSELETTAHIAVSLVTRGPISQSIRIPVAGLFHGHRYTVAPSVRVVDVCGTGLECQFLLDADGFVVEQDAGFPPKKYPLLAIVSPSTSDYTAMMGFEISGGTPLIAPPEANCEIDEDGRVVSVTLTSGGGGFSVPPAVFLVGGGGIGASASVSMTDEYPGVENRRTKSVSSITLTNGGQGYSEPPRVVFIEREPVLPKTWNRSKKDVEKALAGAWDSFGFLGENKTRTVEYITTPSSYKHDPSSWYQYHYGRNRDSTDNIADTPFPAIIRTQFDPLAGSHSIEEGLESTEEQKKPKVVPFFSDGMVVGGAMRLARFGPEGKSDEPLFRAREFIPEATVVTGLAVKSIEVSSGGEGYTSPPEVKISGGGGVGATAAATIDDHGSVGVIYVTKGGWGYTSAPSVEIVGGEGSGATAVASLADPPTISILEVMHDGPVAGSTGVLSEYATASGEKAWRVMTAASLPKQE